MISAIFAVALLSAAADPAAAGATAAVPAASTPAKSTTAAKPDKDGLICKKEAVLGSRMKQRTCLPQSEWDLRKQTARDDLDAAQRNRPLQSN